MKALYFIGGALVGAAAALLLAPESGENTRARIKALIKQKQAEIQGEQDELGMLMEKISAELEEK